MLKSSISKGLSVPHRCQNRYILGYSLEQHLLLVIYVEKGKRNWIISARQATRNERKLYEQTRR